MKALATWFSSCQRLHTLQNQVSNSKLPLLHQLLYAPSKESLKTLLTWFSKLATYSFSRKVFLVHQAKKALATWFSKLPTPSQFYQGRRCQLGNPSCQRLHASLYAPGCLVSSPIMNQRIHIKVLPFYASNSSYFNIPNSL